jgi:hypothetical protein
MTETVNPYAAPTAKVEDVGANPEAEAIRRAHISHEASIRAVGFLYYLGAAGMLFSGISFLLATSSEADSALTAVLLIAFGAGMAFVGHGVRALRRWARIVGSVLAAIGLLGFPVGTIINVYILYLYLSKKGRTVFSPEYQDVIAATPHVKYRISIIVWIFLAVVLGLLLVGVLGPMFWK